MKIADLYNKGLDRLEANAFEEAIQIFKEILNRSSSTKLQVNVYTLIGNAYYEIGDNEEAITSYKKAIILNPDFELASLGLYLAYVDQELSTDAIMEMDRFLKNNDAALYKTTILELLEGLENGYAKEFEHIIKRAAKKNNIKTDPGPSGAPPAAGSAINTSY